MAQRPESGDAERARRLAEKLESVRRDCASQDEDERRRLLRETLEDEVGSLPGKEAEHLVGAVREQLIEEARGREERVTELEQQTAELRARLEQMGREREQLITENEALRSGSEAATAAGGDPNVLAKLREGLRLMTDEKEVTADELGLPASESRLFRMFQALLGFALNYEMGVNLLLTEFSIGPAGGMDTQQFKGYIRHVRERFRACLDNKEGSLGGLKEILEKNSRFLIDLNSAYTSCVYAGSRSVLEKMDPQPILEKSKKRVMGFNFEEAFNAINRVHGDLNNLTRNELWRQFFYKPFREKLSGYIDPQAGAE
jgi:hypothetical protein